MIYRFRTSISEWSGRDQHEQENPRVSANHTQLEAISVSQDTDDSIHENSKNFLPTQCLFCNFNSLALDANIDHMSSRHGLFIPSPEQLSDAEAFLGYLSIIVFEYKECLYCNVEKATVEAVQTHMRDKGHCMINIDAESELLDFWEFSDSEDEVQNNGKESIQNVAIKLSKTEMRLPSGAVINSRSDITQLRARPGLEQSRTRGSQHRSKKAEMKAITAAEKQAPVDEKANRVSDRSDRRLAVRGEMGLLGVSESQRRALQITENKMKRREAVITAAQRYAMQQQPVKTIYYKVWGL